MNFEDKILAYKNSLEILKNEVEEFAKKIETKIPADEKEWKEIYKFAESIISLEQIPNMFLNIENLDKEFDFPLMIMDEKNVLCKKKEKLMQNWKESFLKIDVNMYREKYEAANKKWIGKGRALNNLVTEIQAFGTLKIDVTQIPAILKEIELYQMDEIAYEKKEINCLLNGNRL